MIRFVDKRSENPYNVAHWFGLVDTRPLAALRISLGLALLEDFGARLAEVEAFLTDKGFIARTSPSLDSWTLFNISGSSTPLAFTILVIGLAAAVAFTIGYRARIAAAVMCAVSISVQHRAMLVQTGGDTVSVCLLFFSIFTDVSGRWSFDARRRGERRDVMALAPRFMMYLPVVLYLETARAKLAASGSAWFNGPLIFEDLHLYGWVRPVGAFLALHPSLCALLTTSTIIIELLIPVLFLLPFWNKPARFLAVALHVGLQFGILMTLKVGIFTNVMLAATWLWMLPEWFDFVAARMGERGRFLSAKGIGRQSAMTVAQALMLSAASLLFLMTIADPVVPTHMPRGTRTLLASLGLDLKIGLFIGGIPSRRWVADGALTNGATVDPLQVAVPGTLKHYGFGNTLWMQVPYRLTDYSRFGDFVCRRFNARSAGTLRNWRLTLLTRPPYPPEVVPPPESSELVLSQTCK